MSRQEIQDWIVSLRNHDIELDSNKLIENTFNCTDVLITDISSIILPFFLSEKPIIYCYSSIEATASFENLIEGMYIARSFDDIVHILNELRSGNDWLYEKRKAIASKFRKDNENACERIIDEIKRDYQ